MRVLDLDLDFFVHGIKYNQKRTDARLDESEYPSWTLEETLQFLEGHCGLATPLPGVALEYHADLFYWWRDHIREERIPVPFSVTHVDGHADLGMGDAGYGFVMTELLYRRIEDRPETPEIADHLEDGNLLEFAAACRWLSDITYVRNESFGPPVDSFPSQRTGPRDIPQHLMKNWDVDADALQLYTVDPEEFTRKFSRSTPLALEPEIPLAYLHWPDYRSEAPFDVLCLTRSPNYTPASADSHYQEIRERFIDEAAWG